MNHIGYSVANFVLGIWCTLRHWNFMGGEKNLVHEDVDFYAQNAVKVAYEHF